MNGNFGKTLIALRKQRGLTQVDLARLINVSDKAVSKWETGKGYPEISLLLALSDLFGVSVDYLLKGRQRGIMIAGNILVDIVNTLDCYPERNLLSNVLATTKSVGGCVPNTAISLSRIDPDLYISAVGTVGNDENGRYVISELKKNGIDASCVKITSRLPTTNTTVMVDSITKERTFFYTSGSNSEFDVDDVIDDEMDCDIFHIGYLLLLDALDRKDSEYGTRMARLLHHLRERGIKTSIDVVSKDGGAFAETVVPALPYCSYVILNEYECCQVCGLSPRKSDGTLDVDALREAMAFFFTSGVEEKVIVHCVEAGFLMNRDGSFLIVPSLDLPSDYIKGSVGAGDAFAAGCIYGLHNHYDDRSLLEFASCAAACSLSETDATSGMKSKNEIIKLGEMYQRRVFP